MRAETLLVVLDLVGIAAFAVSGALVAVRRRLDVFGVIVLAGLTGLGGGFLRDVLIGATPPAALQDWRYLVVPLVAGLLVFRFHPVVERLEKPVSVTDALGLGLFCVAGALKAAEAGLGLVPSALLGMVTGIGGGIVRDVLTGSVPTVLREGLYATPALAGAFLAVGLRELGLEQWWWALPGVVVCVVWRLLAVRRGWHARLPPGADGL